jgi:hypothetical protein
LQQSVDETRKILGYLPQEFGVYPKMPALDLLEPLAVMKGITDRKQRKESSFCSTRFRPYSWAVPASGSRRVARIFINVDLPAPLGPSSPNTP